MQTGLELRRIYNIIQNLILQKQGIRCEVNYGAGSGLKMVYKSLDRGFKYDLALVTEG